jgi:ribonuclease P protein component
MPGTEHRVERGYRRSRRISSRSEIRALLASKNRVRRQDIELYWRLGDLEAPARGGVIISTRWRGSKPERNRFRRRFREELRVLLPVLSPGIQILFRLRAMGLAATAGKRRVKEGKPSETVRGLLEDAGLLRG